MTAPQCFADERKSLQLNVHLPSMMSSVSYGTFFVINCSVETDIYTHPLSIGRNLQKSKKLHTNHANLNSHRERFGLSFRSQTDVHYS